MEALRKALERVSSADLTRMSLWLWFALTISIVTLLSYPEQLSNVLAALNKVTLGAWLGYWVSRSIFVEVRLGDLWEAFKLKPSATNARLLAIAMQTRAIVVGAVVLAVAIAL